MVKDLRPWARGVMLFAVLVNSMGLGYRVATGQDNWWLVASLVGWFATVLAMFMLRRYW